MIHLYYKNAMYVRNTIFFKFQSNDSSFLYQIITQFTFDAFEIVVYVWNDSFQNIFNHCQISGDVQ